MNDNNWIQAMAIGDEVAVWNGWDHRIETVSHITKTQVHVGAWKFRRTNGWVVGGGTWSRISLSQVTDEIRREIEFKSLVNKLSTLDRNAFKAMPIGKLRKLERLAFGKEPKGPTDVDA